MVNLKSNKLTLVATRHYDESGPPSYPGWSPDSRWLAYANVLPNELHAIFVYSLASGRATQITDGMSDAEIPKRKRGFAGEGFALPLPPLSGGAGF